MSRFILSGALPSWRSPSALPYLRLGVRSGRLPRTYLQGSEGLWNVWAKRGRWQGDLGGNPDYWRLTRKVLAVAICVIDSAGLPARSSTPIFPIRGFASDIPSQRDAV
jgi:hypothetical protein